MTMAVPAWYSSFMKPVDAFTLPYMVASQDELHTALDGQIGKGNSRLADGAGFKVLGYFLLGGGTSSTRFARCRSRPIARD